MAKKKQKKSAKNMCSMGCRADTGLIYFLGFIGAAVYYIKQAPEFWIGVWGIIKALVWPAILVFKLLGL
jgi:hypothetical protein